MFTTLSNWKTIGQQLGERVKKIVIDYIDQNDSEATVLKNLDKGTNLSIEDVNAIVPVGSNWLFSRDFRNLMIDLWTVLNHKNGTDFRPSRSFTNHYMDWIRTIIFPWSDAVVAKVSNNNEQESASEIIIPDDMKFDNVETKQTWTEENASATAVADQAKSNKSANWTTKKKKKISLNNIFKKTKKDKIEKSDINEQTNINNINNIDTQTPFNISQVPNFNETDILNIENSNVKENWTYCKFSGNNIPCKVITLDWVKIWIIKEKNLKYAWFATNVLESNHKTNWLSIPFVNVYWMSYQYENLKVFEPNIKKSDVYKMVVAQEMRHTKDLDMSNRPLSEGKSELPSLMLDASWAHTKSRIFSSVFWKDTAERYDLMSKTYLESFNSIASKYNIKKLNKDKRRESTETLKNLNPQQIREIQELYINTITS